MTYGGFALRWFNRGEEEDMKMKHWTGPIIIFNDARRRSLNALAVLRLHRFRHFATSRLRIRLYAKRHFDSSALRQAAAACG
nr:hypothetical protein Iba_chr11bCG11190 [Ipomoea batatas]GME15785.1 hypothetical protein Iba_scaffold16721CG0010 [Ipomoea batatas]GME15815.1 hypothetical protein Iba_scaffold16768CG0040 [Ipomoea batatas]